MMKTLPFTFLFALISSFGFAQDRKQIDRLKLKLTVSKQDTNQVKILNVLCNGYRSLKPDSGFFYGQRALTLARQINYPRGEANALYLLGFTNEVIGNYPKALELHLKSLQIAENNDLKLFKGKTLQRIGVMYRESDNFPEAMEYLRESKKIFDSIHDTPMSVSSQNMIGNTFYLNGQLDSALTTCLLAYDNMNRFNVRWIRTSILNALGNIYAQKGNLPLALDYFRKCLLYAEKEGNYINAFKATHGIANLYQKSNVIDSSIYYAEKSLEFAQKGIFYENIISAGSLLADIYERQGKNAQKVIQYHKITIAAKDSLYNYGKKNALQNLTDFDEKERQYEIETATTAIQNQNRQYALLAGLGVFLLIALILYGNNRQKQKANQVLANTLSKLKSTQAQLIQSEKLASLGELTAGIAHEIQNPLNFVNNFSELSTELLEELSEELPDELKTPPSGVGGLLADIIQNQEKINLHGKRASSIVKGMLEHSRTSTGVKELTDINTLADEYLRLAYHGLRAKDMNGSTTRFNADFKTDFDKNLPKIEVIPQDMGRVLLNLINNAFWAVKTVEKPEVVVKTEHTNNQVIIKITDNGIGMVDEVKAKIFQPFFTTKPTGEGTGLGLSLAYDIVTKGHGGTLEVESTEAIGSEFIITLPV
jgi:two-component system NtrC family sensor kinase